MGDSGADIIIKGGSVKIYFNDADYPKKNGDPKEHENPNRKITKIRVLDGSGGELYSSGDHQNGLDYEIRVSTN